MTAKEIVEKWLKDKGHDGLCCDGCGCGIDDLMPCGQFGDLCVPARKAKATAAQAAEFDCPVGSDLFLAANDLAQPRRDKLEI